MERTFKATDEKLYEVIAFVEEELEKYHPDMKAMMAITVALEEMFVNISHYAYAPNTGEATVRLHIDEATRMATIIFIDRGVPFDPLAKADPDVTLAKQDRQIGGLGIYIVKKTMDAVEYQRKDGCNILTIRKQI